MLAGKVAHIYNPDTLEVEMEDVDFEARQGMAKRSQNQSRLSI